MAFTKDEILNLFYVIHKIEERCFKKKFFKTAEKVRYIYGNLPFNESFSETTLRRFLEFEREPNNINEDTIVACTTWINDGRIVSVESFIVQNSKDFGLFKRSQKERHKNFFKKFDEFSSKEVKKGEEKLYDFNSAKVTEFLKQEKQIRPNTPTKKKHLLFLIVVLTVFIISILGFNYYILTRPFNFIAHISEDPKIQIYNGYPQFNPNKLSYVDFHFPSGIVQKEINRFNEIVLVDLSKEYLGLKIRIDLRDKYWKSSTDSVTIEIGKTDLLIRPNESLAKIQGEVFTQVGGFPLKNAKVKIGNLETLTDSNGMFDFLVPIEMRRLEYDLKIVKEGYLSYSKIYYPGARVKIGLLEDKNFNK